MNEKAIQSSDTERLEELLRVDALIKRLPQESLESVLGHAPSESRLEAHMKKHGGRLRRQLKGTTVKETKAQKKLRLQKERAKRNRYAREVARPRRTEWSVRQIKEHGAAGWWDLLSRKSPSSWGRKPYWRIGKEEFVEAVGDSLEDRIVVVQRYDSRKMATLDNIYLVDVDSREVVFDGKEWKMRKLGYIL